MSSSPAPLPSVSVARLLEWIREGGELALVDVREEGVIARDAHLLLSVPLPLSQLELRVARLLPRRAARVVVIDAGDGELAARAARRLAELGYADVQVLAGGVEAWQDAGLEVYTGSSAYSKAFGEFVEHRYGTPHLSVEDLHRRLARGDDLVVLDGRTAQEFEDFSIAGAHAVPNAELPLRVHSLLPSPDTLVVVNCAGRTRSIIGAQALINAGLPNPVLSLRNGTMDWLMAGFELQHGQAAQLPAPPSQDSPALQHSVAHLSRRFAIDWIDGATIGRFETEREARSLYVFDVRTRAEYEAGHLPGSAWIEGGQLVQELDKHVGTRHARIVLVDDGSGVRAAITASWLLQLAWGEVHAHVLASEAATESGPEPLRLPAPLPVVDSWSVERLVEALARGEAEVIDLAPSPRYEEGHIPGAAFAVRARLPHGLDSLRDTTWVLSSPDGRLARLAAAELGARHAKLVVLEGGTAAWLAQQRPLERGATRLLHDADDAVRSPYAAADPHAAFRDYLRWEIDLLDQLQRDTVVRFATFDEAASPA
ncbi:rhodanese-like domain-containing protein [Variovorax sp. J2P1-31]|nr:MULTISPECIES: rhodanese-like domain-containing protein [unclassified Variovorax]MDM0086691.1 rhodanese-like domain-containing protein [Variovorax sp. J22G40]MDM0145053.1 rhodanese-like domain-containing protein [Variovorax sp. J2P1-31]